MQYSNFKDTLQNIASQIGNVEQEVEEHKYVAPTFHLSFPIRTGASICFVLLDVTLSPWTMASNFGLNKTYCWLHAGHPSAAIHTSTCWTASISSFRTYQLVLRILLATTSPYHRLFYWWHSHHCFLYKHLRHSSQTRSQTLTPPTQTRPRHPQTSSQLTQMLPHDQRRARRAHSR
jgi:hypothetical protein